MNFIATEFIDGVTLRERMRNAPMKLGEVLDIAGQIASSRRIAIGGLGPAMPGPREGMRPIG